MSSLDSWIDLQEVAELARKLSPEPREPDDFPDAGVPFTGWHADEDDERPAPLISDVPPEWEPPPRSAHRPSSQRAALDELIAARASLSQSKSEAQAEAASVKAREKLSGIRQKAEDFLKSPPPEFNFDPIPEAQPSPGLVEPDPGRARAFFMPKAPLRMRLKAFTTWVRDITGCEHLVITDRQGYSLLHEDREQDANMVSSALRLTQALSQARDKLSAETPGAGLYLPLTPTQWLGVMECDTSYGRLCVCLVTRAPLAASTADDITRGLVRTLEATSDRD